MNCLHPYFPLGKVANKGQSAENKDKIVLLRFTYLYVSKKAGVENEVLYSLRACLSQLGRHSCLHSGLKFLLKEHFLFWKVVWWKKRHVKFATYSKFWIFFSSHSMGVFFCVGLGSMFYLLCFNSCLQTYVLRKIITVRLMLCLW